MPQCPVCKIPLQHHIIHKKMVYKCSSCQGHLVSITNLRNQCEDQSLINDLWNRARENKDLLGKRCPYCGKPMATEQLPSDIGNHKLDICTHCMCLWFDATELKALKLKEEKELTEDDLIEKKYGKELLAMKLELNKMDQESKEEKDPPSAANIGLAILGLPYEVGEKKIKNRPITTWALVAVMFFAFILSIIHKDIIYTFGFIPELLFRNFGLTMITSFFLHGSLWHLISNTYFFIVFGDNVEDRLGHYAFFFMIFIAHFSGLLLHALFDPNGDIPLIGASGGISAVLAFYAISFPNKKIGFLFRIMYFFRFMKLPAWLYFGFWIVIQIIMSMFQTTGYGGSVSALGHLGGIIVGFITAVYVGNIGKKSDLPDYSER